MQQNFKLVGTGNYLPEKLLTADDIDKRAGLSPSWTKNHIGVLKRYECCLPEDLASMAKAAAETALADAALDWQNIDLIIDASTSKLQPIPFNAALLQQSFGPEAHGIPCLDIGSTCLSFVVALHVANGLLASELYKHILIVSSEAPLKAVNWQEPESACLLGDGAAAVIIKKAEAKDTFFFAHETYSKHAAMCQVVGGLHHLPSFEYSVENDASYRFNMEGPEVFRVARKYLPKMLEALLESIPKRDSLKVVPHPASPRSLKLMRRTLKFRSEQFIDTVAQHGNMVAAGIPFVLSQERKAKTIVDGDLVLLLGTSAGYSQAGLIFQI